MTLRIPAAPRPTTPPTTTATAGRPRAEDGPRAAATVPTGAGQGQAAEVSHFEGPSAPPRLDTEWWGGRPLSEARNAHSTNTREDLEYALDHGYNFLEGDVRQEINPPHAMEMRHDQGHEPGDNLTLREWLEAGKASGRGLKLDVKEGQHLERILADVEASGVPHDRLMFNLGDGDMGRWAEEIRARFPEATLAINPASALEGKHNSGPLQDWQVDRMIALAEQGGAPVTFVVRYDLLTDRAIQRLSAHGPVSVWNSPSQGGVDDVPALTARLRERGVDGVIDLRPSMGLLDKAGAAVSGGWGWLKGKVDELL